MADRGVNHFAKKVAINTESKNEMYKSLMDRIQNRV